MTLDDLERLYRTLPHKWYASFGAHHENMKDPWTLLSGSIRFVRIFVGVKWRGASNDSGVVRKGHFFSNFGRHIFGTFRAKASTIVRRHKCLIGFPVILKCLTLNGLEMPFYGKICFRRGLTTFFISLLETTMWKRMNILPYKMFASDCMGCGHSLGAN